MQTAPYYNQMHLRRKTSFTMKVKSPILQSNVSKKKNYYEGEECGMCRLLQASWTSFIMAHAQMGLCLHNVQVTK